ncbi:MAG: aspartate aminotransferase [Phascolarctobacterium sp.]|nr:MAG: aspartate aminotransferase [Phascolarctobacterium sp.]
MKLFTIGPTQMYETTIKVRSKQIPYFRTKDFSEMVLKTNSMLKRYINTSNNSEIIWLTASGTGGMEATIINCFNKNDKLLVIVGGNFGARFAEICKIHDIPYDILSISYGNKLTEDDFTNYYGNGYTGVIVNLHETSTGQLYDINLIKNFCKRENAYLIVDAIGTFLCDEFKMDENGIDVAIVSSQKGLCVSPGISLIFLNNKIIKNKILTNNVKSLYFDFKNYINNIHRGQTPYTPAVGIVYEIYDMLNFIENNGGISKHLEIIKKRAQYFRDLLKKNNLTYPSYPLSNALTPVIIKKPLAKEIFKELKDNFDLIVNPVGGENADYVFRVAHIGNLNFYDYNLLIEKIKNIIGMR